jgi:hypothetical protein
MAEWHIPEELLERFLRLETSKQESRQVVRHLLGGCPRCLEMAHRLTSETGIFTSFKGSRKSPWKQSYVAQSLALPQKTRNRDWPWRGSGDGLNGLRSSPLLLSYALPG